MPPTLQVERLFQCDRCRKKWVRILDPQDIPLVKCPNACPVSVKDITEKEIAELEAIRARKAKVAQEREQKDEAERAALEAKFKTPKLKNQ